MAAAAHHTHHPYHTPLAVAAEEGEGIQIPSSAGIHHKHHLRTVAVADTAAAAADTIAVDVVRTLSYYVAEAEY